MPKPPPAAPLCAACGKRPPRNKKGAVLCESCRAIAEAQMNKP